MCKWCKCHKEVLTVDAGRQQLLHLWVRDMADVKLKVWLE